jgi:hypothetical protein
MLAKLSNVLHVKAPLGVDLRKLEVLSHGFPGGVIFLAGGDQCFYAGFHLSKNIQKKHFYRPQW